MFSNLPMLAISRDLRKPGPTSMARPCFCLFAETKVYQYRAIVQGN
jgi:hypothetical protein